MRRRPWFTWPITPHDLGATRLYQGHRVAFGRPSRPERWRIAAPSGVKRPVAASVSDGSVAGLVRTGPKNWMATSTATTRTAAQRTALRMLSPVYEVRRATVRRCDVLSVTCHGRRASARRVAPVGRLDGGTMSRIGAR